MLSQNNDFNMTLMLSFCDINFEGSKMIFYEFNYMYYIV